MARCPQCGDEFVDGRCRFCGFRPTAEDRAAIERWNAQKAMLEGTGSEQGAARGRTAPGQKPGWEPEQPRAPEPAGKDPRTVRRPAPSRKKKARKKPPARQRDGPGLLGRLLPRLAALAWASLLAYLMLSELLAKAGM